MELFVGTSGYSYKEWKGSFYPADLPDGQMLRYYGEHFRSVEINNTFYRMPRPSVLEAWTGEVPEDFRFVLKAPQRITHMQRLREVDDSVAYLLSVASVLGPRLGPLLFQLPPNLKKDVERLRGLLRLLPEGTRAALEFRHPSWFDDETLAVLAEHGAALCVAEAEDDLPVPFAATTGWGYLRLRLPDYSDAALEAWAARLRGTGWSEAFVFFKHEDAGTGPRLAHRFLALAGPEATALAREAPPPR